MVVQIISGCYDGSIHGWELKEAMDSQEKEKFKLVFAYKAHQSCTKSLACGNTSQIGGQKILLASGGTDEIVRIYNLTRMIEVGELFQHQGTILSLCFIGNKFLMTGGEDGQLLLWRAKDWELVSTLKGHKPGPVTSIAVHPSAKVALSTSCDNSLRMWNLETARSASRNRLEEYKVLDSVVFSPAGDSYMVIADSKTALLFSVQDDSGKPFATLKYPVRVNALMFLDETSFVVGLDNGELKHYTFQTNEEPELKHSMKCAARVRQMGKFLANDTMYITAGLSSGEIQVWNLESEQVVASVRVGSGTHLTCMLTISNTESSKEDSDNNNDKKKKQKKKKRSTSDKKETKKDEATPKETKRDSDSLTRHGDNSVKPTPKKNKKTPKQTPKSSKQEQQSASTKTTPKKRSQSATPTKSKSTTKKRKKNNNSN